MIIMVSGLTYIFTSKHNPNLSDLPLTGTSKQGGELYPVYWIRGVLQSKLPWIKVIFNLPQTRSQELANLGKSLSEAQDDTQGLQGPTCLLHSDSTGRLDQVSV